MRSSLARAVMATAMVVLSSLHPASAGTPEAPEVVDVAGDANFVNSQGRNDVPDQNISTSPASIASADIQAIWLETLYSTVTDRDPDGNVLRVRHVPEALRVSIRTTAPAKPTFGQGVIFRVGARVGESCDVQLQLYLAGNLPGASTIERAEINRVRNCPGGVGIIPEFPFAIAGVVTSITFPFDRSLGVLADGLTLGPFTPPHTRVVLPTGGSGTTIPAIDQTALLPEFTIGSDVPAGVDCGSQPSHPECG